MKRIKYIIIFMANILILGCNMEFPRPLILEEKFPNSATWELNRKRNPKRFKNLSKTCASLGWSSLKSYHMHGKYMYQLEQAANNFNDCWKYDSENYNSYWGWGIIFSILAEKETQKDALNNLLNSIKCFELTPVKNIPNDELVNFYMDWANVYNGLGAYYKKEQRNEDTKKMLDLSKDILLKLLDKKTNASARIYFLLSVNYFYRDDYIQANYYMQKAKEGSFSIPSLYERELNKIE